MDIRDKITEWQTLFNLYQGGSEAEMDERNRELELVLFAIDGLVGGRGTSIEVAIHKGEPRISLSKE